MAWFDELGLPGFTVTGRFAWVREDGPDEDDLPDIQPASGTVTFTPTAKAVRVDGAWVGIRPVQALIFDGEIVVSEDDPRQVRLLSTDAETGVEGWGWEASIRIADATIRKTVPFLGPADTDVSLTGDDLIPITGLPVEVITVEGGDGLSAYQVAVEQGYAGTEAEWLASLKGDPGEGASVEYVGDGVYEISSSPVRALTSEGRLPTKAVEHAERISADALGSIPSRVAPIQKGTPEGFAIADEDGRVAFEITEEGSAKVGATEHREELPGYRILDQDGRVAFEVTSEGQTRIHDAIINGDHAEDVDTLHVFVGTGQSNMSGRGIPIQGPVSPRVMQFGRTRRVIETAPIVLDTADDPSGTARTGPLGYFARNYLASQPANVGVLLIPASRGATGFRGTPEETAPGFTWVKGAGRTPEAALYDRSVEQIVDGIAAARALGYHVILKGILWSQGGSNVGMSQEEYAGLLDDLINNYRADLEHPTLPVLIGQQAPEALVVDERKVPIDAAHQDTPYRTPFTGFAPCPWDSHNPGDTTHLSAVGMLRQADNYLTAYHQAVGNTFRP